MSYWLWMLVVAMGSAIGVFVMANFFLPADRAVARDELGQDFLAFYSAGRLVNAGDSPGLYNLQTLGEIQRSIAAEANLPLASDVAPWWNPPFAAWLFAPLATLPFRPALVLWTLLNLACLTAAGWLLTSIIRNTSERRRDWLLVPSLLIVAPATWQALGHGQNSCVSLLILAVTVLAWRARRPLFAGLAWSLLCYKPQLAGIAGIAMFATLGWRFLVGAMLGLVPVLIATIDFMPGALWAFLTHLPANLTEFQRTHPPLWHRHVTLEGFARAFAAHQGWQQSAWWLSVVSPLSVAGAISLAGRSWWKLRAHQLEEEGIADLALDRFIALILLLMPLATSYFVDYDLLLLAAPAVLMAREMMLTADASQAATWIRRTGPLLFIWLAINPPLAEATGISLTLPLLLAIVLLQVRRAARLPKIPQLAMPMAAGSTGDSPTRLAA